MLGEISRRASAMAAIRTLFRRYRLSRPVEVCAHEMRPAHPESMPDHTSRSRRSRASRMGQRPPGIQPRKPHQKMLPKPWAILPKNPRPCPFGNGGRRALCCATTVWPRRRSSSWPSPAPGPGGRPGDAARRRCRRRSAGASASRWRMPSARRRRFQRQDLVEQADIVLAKLSALADARLGLHVGELGDVIIMFRAPCCGRSDAEK